MRLRRCTRAPAGTKNLSWGKVSAARVHASVSVTHVRTETERSVCFLLHCRGACSNLGDHVSFRYRAHSDPFPSSSEFRILGIESLIERELVKKFGIKSLLNNYLLKITRL